MSTYLRVICQPQQGYSALYDRACKALVNVFGVGGLEKKHCHRKGLLVVCCQLIHGATHHLNSMRQVIASEATRIVVGPLNETNRQHMNLLAQASHGSIHWNPFPQDRPRWCPSILLFCTSLSYPTRGVVQGGSMETICGLPQIPVSWIKDVVTGTKHCAAWYVHACILYPRFKWLLT